MASVSPVSGESRWDKCGADWLACEVDERRTERAFREAHARHGVVVSGALHRRNCREARRNALRSIRASHVGHIVAFKIYGPWREDFFKTFLLV